MLKNGKKIPTIHTNHSGKILMRKTKGQVKVDKKRKNLQRMFGMNSMTFFNSMISLLLQEMIPKDLIIRLI